MSRQKGVKGATNTLATLPREAIDEAFAEQPIVAESIRGSRRDLTGQHRQERTAVAQQAFSAEKADLLHNISTQLEMLKKQQEHLQRLLDQAQSS
ncbi:MAG: hypothetical protein KDA57_20605 [Planctomycetales bacterium]|nr:hypothetical protein [Planctomycetales bacterium]